MLSTTVVIVAAVAIFNVVFNIAGAVINLIEAIVVIAVLVIIISSCPQFQTELSPRCGLICPDWNLRLLSSTLAYPDSPLLDVVLKTSLIVGSAP